MSADYRGPIRRVKSGKGHKYLDANGARVPGVTTLIDGIRKKAIENWNATATAAYAIDNWEELSALPPSQRLARLTKARFESKDLAANRGSEVHDLATHLILGEEMDVPEEIAGHVESLVHFFDSYDVQPVLTEFVVFSHTHGYAGTGDAVLDFPNGLPEPHPYVSRVLPAPALRLMVDYKTNRTGIYGETALQLAGYSLADTYLDANGVEQPMIKVDGCAGVHITGDYFSLIPLEAGPAQLRTLLYAGQVRDFSESARDLVGDPIRVPSRIQRRRLDIVRSDVA